jgi:hypothetical protein
MSNFVPLSVAIVALFLGHFGAFDLSDRCLVYFSVRRGLFGRSEINRPVAELLLCYSGKKHTSGICFMGLVVRSTTPTCPIWKRCR